jgi:cyclic di-GMP phosphodiesterase Gmr
MRIAEANKAMRDLLGASVDEWRDEDLAAFIHGDDIVAVQQALKRKGEASIEVRLCKRGRRAERICHLRATTAHASETDESTVIVVLTDVTEHRRAVDRLELQARRDALTGLLNRRAFLEELEGILDSRTQGQFGLIFVDVDNLKTINDERGHRAGDLALRATAMRIERSLRVGDVAGRYGGDEFVVAVRVLDGTALETLRERIDLALSEPLVSDTLDLPMSCSVGAALALEEDDIEQLLQRADGDMYASKAARRAARGQ